MKEIIIETLLDSIKLLPFLFITFLIIELFEHKVSKKTHKLVEKESRFGPVIGAILGVIPQCGFSVAATNLYVTRIITLGTLFAVYLSTSDEMLPILIAERAPLDLIIKILVIKVFVGIVCGIIIDLVIRKKQKPKYDICKHDDCDCENKIIKASLKHTLNIFIFILVCTFVINIALEFIGIENLGELLLKDSLLGPFLTSLIGLIPNCAASVFLTELFLSNAISFGSLLAGLLAGSGVALLVLFKENTDKKESLKILLGLYLIGALVGVLIEIFIKIF